MIVKCNKCRAIGERFGTGLYQYEDYSFKCKKCGYKGLKARDYKL